MDPPQEVKALVGDWDWEKLSKSPKEVYKSHSNNKDARMACAYLLRCEAEFRYDWYVAIAKFVYCFLRWIKYAQPERGFYVQEHYCPQLLLNANTGAHARVIFMVLNSSIELLCNTVRGLVRTVVDAKVPLKFPVVHWVCFFKRDSLLEFFRVLVDKKYNVEARCIKDYDVTVPLERAELVSFLYEIREKMIEERVTGFNQSRLGTIEECPQMTFPGKFKPT